MPARRFTDKQEQEICRRYEAGETPKNLAAELGVEATLIRDAVKRQGGTLRTYRQAQGGLTDAQLQELRCRYEAGESTTSLQKHFGKGRSVLCRNLKAMGVEIRPVRERHNCLTDEQELEVCDLYAQGENFAAIGKRFGFSAMAIKRVLQRHRVPLRSSVEHHGGLPRVLTSEICSRYLAGENTVELAASYGVTNPTIGSIIKGAGIELRSGNGICDTVEHALNSTGRFRSLRECEFYLYELVNYAATHSKPGIAFNADLRANSEYGSAQLRILFASRQEAFFLEQAVLDATRGSAQCPPDLIGWTGATEVRAQPAADIEPIVLRLADEMEELGMWEFAARYVPMTAAQRAICQQRALEVVTA